MHVRAVPVSSIRRRSPPWTSLLALVATLPALADEPTVLEPFTVTGSRIEQSGGATSIPVRRFSADDIAVSGQATVAGFLRSMPWNSSGNYSPANAVGLNAAQTAVNLRGLGASNTLVLLNGRRVALFGQPDGSTLSADIGNLPAAAIESIEVLRESASALYGSDAIAGVVNVRLRENYRGTHAAASYRQFFDTDWSRRTAALTFGATRGATSVLVVLDHAAANDVRFSDRPVSQTEDRRRFGGLDLRQNFGWPGQVFIPTDLASAPPAARGGFATVGAVSDGVVTIGAPTATPLPADFVRLPVNVTDGRPTPGDSQNNFDRAPYTSMLPAEEMWGAYVRLKQELGPEVDAFCELGWRHRVLTTSIHPTPAGTSLESASGVGDGPGGAIIFPAGNPYNPFGADLPLLLFQLVELGPRIRQFTNDVPRVLAGVEGRSGAWRWEAAALYSGNSLAEDTRNYITDADLQAGLSGRLGGYLNPFGPSDDGVVDRARASLHVRQECRMSLADVHASGPLASLPAGPLRAAFGAEARHDDFRSEPDELAARGGYVAWSAINRQQAARDVRAVFAEFQIPLTRQLEGRLAARWEEYSDFGRTAKPTFALAWKPLPWLTLRASRSAAFKAPELLDLHAGQTETYGLAVDPLRPDLATYTVRYRTGGNPDLQPEDSVSWQSGLSLAVPGLPGLEVGASWWQIDKAHMVGALGLPFLVQHERDPAFPTADRIVRAPADSAGRPGQIVLVNDTKGNFDNVTVSGWDFDLAWSRRFEGVGELRASLGASWLRQWRFASRTTGTSERAGSDGYPEWRAQAAVGCVRAPWSASLAADFIGRHEGGGVNYAGGPVGQSPRAFLHLRLSRAMARRTQVALTISNLLDTDPPVELTSSRGYNPLVYDNYGRAFALSIERDF